MDDTSDAASEKFTFNLHFREFLSCIPLTDECTNPLMEAASGNGKKIQLNALNFTLLEIMQNLT